MDVSLLIVVAGKRTDQCAGMFALHTYVFIVAIVYTYYLSKFVLA